MNNFIYAGDLVRLEAVDPEIFAVEDSLWAHDSEYWRLCASDPSRLFTSKQTREWIDKSLPTSYFFSIYALTENKLIGGVDLNGINWSARTSWIGIGIGDRNYWGRGYGREAMRLAIQFAFDELNLRRINLNVFEYNKRAFLAYQKLGFVEEGRYRSWLHRGGRRWDLIFMGLLRSDWNMNTLEK